MVNMILKSEECILLPKLSCHFCGIYMYPPGMFLCFTKRTKKGGNLKKYCTAFLCTSIRQYTYTRASMYIRRCNNMCVCT